MSVNKIIIENFKVFEGQHVFDLKNLNIFTGQNSSGKSSLFKAISLFGRALVRGDFPSIQMFDNYAGEFSSLVNRNSGSKRFKIGFFIELGAEKVLYKVLYEFVAHKERARFFGLEVVDQDENVFLSINDTFLLNSSQSKNYNFNYYNRSDKKQKDVIFSSPAYDDSTPTLTVRLNILHLKENISKFSTDNFELLVQHLESIKGTDGYWWAECLEEQDYEVHVSDRSFLKLEHIYTDLVKDSLLNLGDEEQRNYGIWSEVDNNFKNYFNNLKTDSNYLQFIDRIIKPVFEKILKGLEFFRETNFTHITFQDFEKRLITKNIENKFLFDLIPYTEEYDGPNKFVRDSLKIFGIDGYVELKPVLNAALEVSLVTNTDETDLNIDKELSKLGRQRIFFDYKNDYKRNPRQNIADLGKGTANLISLILKLFSINFEHTKSNWINSKTKTKDENATKAMKWVLIEEPEAFLHPNWQSRLADFLVFFMNDSKQNNYSIIVETHSEYIIRKFQLLIANNKLDPDKLILYYFNHPGNIPDREPQIKQIRITKAGSLTDDLGAGFIDESTNIVFDLLKLNQIKNN